MIQNLKGKRQGEVFALDIQNRNGERNLRDHETSLYLLTLIKEKSTSKTAQYFNDAEAFLRFMEEYARVKKRKTPNEPKRHENAGLYVFDLGMFFSFVFPILKNKGFEQVQEITNDQQNVYSILTDETPAVIWIMELKFGKNDGTIIFKSLNMMFSHNGTLYDMAEHLGLRFRRSNIDIFKDRPDDYKATPAERLESYRNARLIMDILLAMKKEKDFFLSHTVASFSIRKLISHTYGWAKNPKGCYRSSKNYPLLDDEIEENVRKSIYGGLCSPNVIYQDEVIDNLIHIDATQHYPSTQARYAMPYGTPVHYIGAGSGSISKARLLHVKIWGWTFTKFHALPYLEQHGEHIAYNGVFDLWIWSFELNMACECYENIQYKIIECYEFDVKKVPWIDFFEDNIASRNIARQFGDEFGVALYKLMNNAAIGKFIQKPRPVEYETYLNDYGVIKNRKQKIDKNAVTGYSYSPLGSYTLARARYRLYLMARRFGFENVVYKDTDSLFILSNEHTEKTLQTMKERGEFHDGLGGWTLCDRAINGRFVMAKRYQYTDQNGEIHSKASGMALNASEIIDITGDEVRMIVKNACKGGTLYAPIKKRFGGSKNGEK